MAVTIHDVAARAGVSASTVSRVLNRNHDISPETVEIVESAIAHLGYRRGETQRGRRPTRRAASNQRFASLALLIPDSKIEAMQTPLTGGLVHGMESVARQTQHNFILTRLSDDGSLPLCLAPVQVDGLVVRSGSMRPRIPLPNIPTVWIFLSSKAPSYGDQIYPDNEAIGSLALDYLYRQRGRRRLAVWNPLPLHAEAPIRAEHFRRSAQETEASVTKFAFDSASSPEELSRLLGEGSDLPYDGLFLAIGDSSNEQVYRLLEQRGIRVGEDIDLIACNNDASRLQALNPTLANIDIRAAEIGRMAAETLLWRLDHPEEHRRCILIEPRLVVPGSPFPL